jgi:hypothetical protein
MATKNLIPRGSGEGGIGITDTVWGYGYYDTGNFNKGLFVSGKNIDEVIADAVAGGGLGGVWNAGAGGIIYYNGGNVGIGTTSPDGTLELNSSSTDTNFYMGGTPSVGTREPWRFQAEGDNLSIGQVKSSFAKYMTFSGSKVGIGTTDPQDALHIKGDDKRMFIGSDDYNLFSLGRRSSTQLDTAYLTMQHEGTQTVAIDASGSTFFNGGSVGIGTANPGATLQVKASDDSANALAFWVVNKAHNNSIISAYENGDVSLGTLTYKDASGNVGIGTASPVFAKLQIEGSSNATRVGLLIGDAVGRASSIHQEGNFLKIDDFTGNSASLMAINTLNGNVGIGTASPECPLMIKADPSGDSMFKMLDERAYVANEPRAGISFQGLDSGGNRSAFAGIEGYGAGSGKGGLRFLSRPVASSTAVGMVLNEDGNVGIGTTSPVSQLSILRENSGVDSGSQDTAFASIEVLTKNTSASVNSKTGWLTQIGCYSLMNANGNMPSKNAVIAVYKHDASANETALIRLSRSADSAEQYFWVDNIGNLRTSESSNNAGSSTGGTVVGTQTSDERIKNIEDSFEYGLNDVLKLKPIAFTLKEQKDGSRKLGFGAQSTRPIIPESVFDSNECIDGYDSDPEDDSGARQIAKSDQTKLGMEYTQLIPVLTKAIQEQQALIEDLKSRIETLENK